MKQASASPTMQGFTRRNQRYTPIPKKRGSILIGKISGSLEFTLGLPRSQHSTRNSDAIAAHSVLRFHLRRMGLLHGSRLCVVRGGTYISHTRKKQAFRFFSVDIFLALTFRAG